MIFKILSEWHFSTINFHAYNVSKGPKIFDAKQWHLADAIQNVLALYWWWIELYFYNFKLISERSNILYLWLKDYLVDSTLSLLFLYFYVSNNFKTNRKKHVEYFFSCAMIVFNILYNVFIASIVTSNCPLNFKSGKMKKKINSAFQNC